MLVVSVKKYKSYPIKFTHKSTAIINVSLIFLKIYIIFFYKIKCVQSISILISPSHKRIIYKTLML